MCNKVMDSTCLVNIFVNANRSLTKHLYFFVSINCFNNNSYEVRWSLNQAKVDGFAPKIELDSSR